MSKKCKIFSVVLVLMLMVMSVTITEPISVSAKTKYVYVTNTNYGTKYHRKNCRTIKRSKKIKLTKKRAKKCHYKRCRVCRP